MVTHRHCPRCNRSLPQEAFRRLEEPASPRLAQPPEGWWSSWCRECGATATREWRERNPEHVTAYNESRRVPPTSLVFSECGATFRGRKDRLICGKRRCKDARYRRLHPEEYRAKQQRQYVQRRARIRLALLPKAPEGPCDRCSRTGRRLRVGAESVCVACAA